MGSKPRGERAMSPYERLRRHQLTKAAKLARYEATLKRIQARTWEPESQADATAALEGKEVGDE